MSVEEEEKEKIESVLNERLLIASVRLNQFGNCCWPWQNILDVTKIRRSTVRCHMRPTLVET